MSQIPPMSLPAGVAYLDFDLDEQTTEAEMHEFCGLIANLHERLTVMRMERTVRIVGPQAMVLVVGSWLAKAITKEQAAELLALAILAPQGQGGMDA